MEKSKNTFFAMMARMKYIERWALMRNSEKENISEHSLEVAIIAHALAVIGNVKFQKSYREEHIALLGMYHDCTEIITGDMPTPIKYENPDIHAAYKEIEKGATFRLLHMLPEEMRATYKGILVEDPQDKDSHRIVKAADKLSALIKCIEEGKAGNQEFHSAKETIEKAIKDMDCEEANYFCQEYLPAYYKTLDEL